MQSVLYRKEVAICAVISILEQHMRSHPIRTERICSEFYNHLTIQANPSYYCTRLRWCSVLA